MTAQQRHREKVLEHAEQRLALKPGRKPAEILGLYKKFLKVEEHRLRMAHGTGASGREIAQGRAHVMEVLLRHIFGAATDNVRQDTAPVPLLLCAMGGFGRGELSPYSDIDIMFLHNTPARGAKSHPY